MSDRDRLRDSITSEEERYVAKTMTPAELREGVGDPADSRAAYDQKVVADAQHEFAAAEQIATERTREVGRMIGANLIKGGIQALGRRVVDDLLNLFN